MAAGLELVLRSYCSRVESGLVAQEPVLLAQRLAVPAQEQGPAVLQASARVHDNCSGLEPEPRTLIERRAA